MHDIFLFLSIGLCILNEFLLFQKKLHFLGLLRNIVHLHSSSLAGEISPGWPLRLSTEIRPPKYGPVSTSTSVLLARQSVARAETAEKNN